MTTFAILLLGLASYAVWQYWRCETGSGVSTCERFSCSNLHGEWKRHQSMTPRERFEYEHCGDWSGRVHAYSEQARFMSTPPRRGTLGGSRMHPGAYNTVPDFIACQEAERLARAGLVSEAKALMEKSFPMRTVEFVDGSKIKFRDYDGDATYEGLDHPLIGTLEDTVT